MTNPPYTRFDNSSSRSGAKFIHTHSVRTPAWFIT